MNCRNYILQQVKSLAKYFGEPEKALIDDEEFTVSYNDTDAIFDPETGLPAIGENVTFVVYGRNDFDFGNDLNRKTISFMGRSFEIQEVQKDDSCNLTNFRGMVIG